MEFLDKILKEGIDNAANVLKEMTGFDVRLNSSNISEFNIDKNIENSYILKQKAFDNEGLFIDFYFTMITKEFLKFLSVIEGETITEVQNEEELIDSFMEVGNIICGNVISSFANALNKKFYFSLPVIEKISYNNDLILKGVRVKFEIKEFDIQGNLMFAMSPESFDLFNNSLSR
ncbi:chemotaxis protein CheX [Marinitoga sp. 1138]|uniref:chemotaxis protein CheX n=1 Tax=Marinitoga sp. 1138 TaxID=1643334 RepID=UPI0015865C07|nr:hypothetical protein [Marinitoga sp. 1138]